MTDLDEKYYPHNIAWIILNRLKDFNNDPQKIRDLSDRFNKLTTHTIYYKFAPLYEEAVKYFDVHNKFPDLAYFNERFTDGRLMWEMNNASFSIDMYDKLKKQLDYELIIQGFALDIAQSNEINVEACKKYIKIMQKFVESNVDVPLDVKEDWINSYDKFKETYHGISTGIKPVDEEVGDFTGLVTIAAPSGNGKSTFALSLAYNISTQKDDVGLGRNVLYISYEMNKFQLQANLVSIESSFNEKINQRLKATDIKSKNLSPEEEVLYKQYMDSYMQRLNYSGGYLSLMDNTSMEGSLTIEDFLTCIESHSAKLGKNFDIIVIDNVDSLKVLQGERGQSEMEKMNGFITKLDAFTKTYMDGYGTCIVLLSQTNREGLKKLKAMEANGTQEISIDYTSIQSYSALYERAAIVLILYSSAVMRASNQLKLMPVKLRNKPLPRTPLTLTTRWEYSYVGGSYVPPTVNNDDLTSMVNPDYNYDDEEFGLEFNTGLESEDENENFESGSDITLDD
jgi:KaiC/GvpD/RAD55 family RecA-like ATPase